MPETAAEPPFVPREGQIDYTNIRRAPVVNCVITCGGKLLLVHRGHGLRFYPDAWNGVSGFLDEPDKSVEEKVREELHEEIGVRDGGVVSIEVSPATIEVDAPEYGKTWIVHPVRVELAAREVNLDWEAQDHAWIDPTEALQYPLVPGFDKLLRMFSLIS